MVGHEATRSSLEAKIAARWAAKASSSPRRILIGLFGRGIQLSRTPAMHEREAARLGIALAYVLVDFDELGLADSDLATVLTMAESLGFDGLNVTHPFKQSVLQHLDELSPEAAAIGAVNTVVLHGGRRVGHNTDSWGFAESFREELAGQDAGEVVQFGAGGAGAAVSHALLANGIRRLSICDADLPKARQLASRIAERFSVPVLAVANGETAMATASGVVNTTPVGMAAYPGTPFDANWLRRDQWVADVIYFPAETELLTKARALGCRTLAGNGMAVYQAVKAFELFTGTKPDRQVMAEYFREAL